MILCIIQKLKRKNGIIYLKMVVKRRVEFFMFCENMYLCYKIIFNRFFNVCDLINIFIYKNKIVLFFYKWEKYILVILIENMFFFIIFFVRLQ